MLVPLTDSKIDQWILDNYHPYADIIGATLEFQHETPDAKVYDDGFGDWFCIGGYCLPFAMIRAESFCDAFDIYLDEFCVGEEPEDGEEAELGHFTNSGKWFSEVTCSYVVQLWPKKVIFDIRKA